MGGHLGDGEGGTGFFFFFTGAFFVGVAFTVAFAVAVGVADGVADALTVAFGVGVGVFVAAIPCAGISARQRPINSSARLIDRSI